MRARLAARRGVPFPPFALSSRDCEHHKLLSTERLRQNVRMFAVFRRYILLPGFEICNGRQAQIHQRESPWHGLWQCERANSSRKPTQLTTDK